MNESSTYMIIDGQEKRQGFEGEAGNIFSQARERRGKVHDVTITLVN